MDTTERVARAICKVEYLSEDAGWENQIPAARAAIEAMDNEDTWLAARIEKMLAELPETITLDDVKHHGWLRRLVVAADDLNTRTEYPALEWSKMQP